MENTTKPGTGKNREFILLVLVALIGAAGLLALQFARKTPAAGTEDRSMVQSGAQSTAFEATSAPLQKIPGNLVTKSEDYPEAGQPFLFRMANFTQGAVYELDLGDGSRRKQFHDGLLRHTYQKTGEYEVSLYARFEGQEVELKLETVTKKVVVPRKVERVEISPVIDN